MPDVIDVDDVVLTRGHVCVTLPDRTAVEDLAIRTLPDMARDRSSPLGNATPAIGMRDEVGTLVYSASLTMRGDWAEIPRASPITGDPLCRP